MTLNAHQIALILLIFPSFSHQYGAWVFCFLNWICFLPRAIKNDLDNCGFISASTPFKSEAFPIIGSLFPLLGSFVFLTGLVFFLREIENGLDNCSFISALTPFM